MHKWQVIKVNERLSWARAKCLINRLRKLIIQQFSQTWHLLSNLSHTHAILTRIFVFAWIFLDDFLYIKCHRSCDRPLNSLLIGACHDREFWWSRRRGSCVRAHNRRIRQCAVTGVRYVRMRREKRRVSRVYTKREKWERAIWLIAAFLFFGWILYIYLCPWATDLRAYIAVNCRFYRSARLW